MHGLYVMRRITFGQRYMKLSAVSQKLSYNEDPISHLHELFIFLFPDMVGIKQRMDSRRSM